jgi:hypothetical protein
MDGFRVLYWYWLAFGMTLMLFELAVLAEATQRGITMVTEAITDQELPAMYLPGEKYINSLQVMATSPNAKTVLIPADLPSALRGILGAGSK